MKEFEIVESKAYEYLDKRYDALYTTKQLKELGNPISVGLTETYIAGYKQCLEDFLKDVKERETILRSEIHEEEDNIDEKMTRINECLLITVRMQEILLELIISKKKK